MKDSDRLRALGRLLLEEAGRVDQFHRLRAQLTRGGFPSSSVPEAISRSAEPPLPMFDRIDRRLDTDRRLIRSKTDDVWEFGQWLSRTLNAWLIPVGELVQEPEPIGCATCDNVVSGQGENRLRASPLDGRLRVCVRCYRHEQRHGLPFGHVHGDVRAQA